MEYLYTPRYCYISPLCFTAQRMLEVHDPMHRRHIPSSACHGRSASLRCDRLLEWSSLHRCHASSPCWSIARCAGEAIDSPSCTRQPLSPAVESPLEYHSPIPSTRPWMQAVGRTERMRNCKSIAHLFMINFWWEHDQWSLHMT